jgi:hypothetical protein
LQRLNKKLERLDPADCTIATLMEKLVGTVDAYTKPEQDEEPAGGTSDRDSDYDLEEVANMSVGGAVSEKEYDEDDEAPNFFGYDMAISACADLRPSFLPTGTVPFCASGHLAGSC